MNDYSNNDSVSEQQISTSVVEKLKSRDQRWRDVDTMIKAESEIRDSVIIKTVLEVVEQEAVIALEKLIHADPTDTKLMISLQACIRRARIIGETLEEIRRKGVFAQNSLVDEGPVNVEP